MIKQLTRHQSPVTRHPAPATRLKHAHHIKSEANGKYAVYDSQQRFRARFSSYAEAEAYVQERERQHRRQ